MCGGFLLTPGSPGLVGEFYHLAASEAGGGLPSLSQTCHLDYLLGRPLPSVWLFIYLEQSLPSGWLILTWIGLPATTIWLSICPVLQGSSLLSS